MKWDSTRPDQHEVARYECHPLLGVRDILRRIALCYADPASPLCALAQALVRQAAHRRPDASLLYLEVSEEGNPRSSFDINLYKAGMLLGDARAADGGSGATGRGSGRDGASARPARRLPARPSVVRDRPPRARILERVCRDGSPLRPISWPGSFRECR
ncbi:hypothetical protein LP420_40150 [Massilia sp. B-10]|nr:hypothetical protein LP420_40150 [Massilia sp. B-10]UUZ54380.1 hypothetical protein LP419_39535 [Massilia sp. H-1]